MRRIVVLAHNLAVESEAVRYATRIALASHAEVVCLGLVTSYSSTAELIHSQPAETMGELRGLRGRQSTAEWVHTLENLRSSQWREVERQKEDLKQHLEDQGVGFSCRILPFEAKILFRTLRDLQPIDLLVAAKLRFPKDLASQGIMTLGDLGSRFSCPAIDVDIMQRFLDPHPRQLLIQLAAYGGGVLFGGLWFWRHAAEINQFVMRGGVIPAVAIMGSAALVAWGYGKAVQCLLRVAKLDIY